METTILWTMNAIRDSVRSSGSHWFDPAAMQSFRTHLLSDVYHGPGGIYFVTSEQLPHEPRACAVRQFIPPAEIETIGEVAEMSRGRAKRLARRLADTPLETQWLEAIHALDGMVEVTVTCPTGREACRYYLIPKTVSPA